MEPPGDCRSELDFIFKLGQRLKNLYRDEYDQPRNRPIRDLTWDYPTEGPLQEPSAEAVLKEINGYTVADRQAGGGLHVARRTTAQPPAAAGSIPAAYRDGINHDRPPQAALGTELGRAGVGLGVAAQSPHPIQPRLGRSGRAARGRNAKRLVWWDERKKQWTGEDTPDFIADRPPSYRPPQNARGKDTISGIDPFIMQADGKGWIYVPTGLEDGPLPTHYEPEESVIKNPLYGQQCNPARMEWRRQDNPYHRAYDDPRFPYLLTTYRLTEHHTAGGMSRWLSWLCELQPEMFCEVSPELAAERGLKNGGWATIRTARAEIEARVLVTERVRPLKIRGRIVHQIGLPYHWSSKGLVRGDPANDLIEFVADPNVSIQESKAFTGQIEPGRTARGRRAATSGPLVPPIDPKYDLRDLPGVRRKPEGPHGFKAEETKEGNI